MRLHDENASFRINQTGLRKFLGDLECEIMELIWKQTASNKDNPTVTVRDIYNQLREERTIAYTTVMTTMMRLAEKDILKIIDKAGLANCYIPAQSRDEFLRSTVAMVLERFLKDFPRQANEFLTHAKYEKVKRSR